MLTQKASGPYSGLWGLPGGAIEFRESPEEAVIREILEETAFHAFDPILFISVTYNGSYQADDDLVEFHHVGILYRVDRITAAPDVIAQEEVRWADFRSLSCEELTPFARVAVMQLQETFSQ